MNHVYRKTFSLVLIGIAALLLAACDASVIEVRIEPPAPNYQPPPEESGTAGDGSSRGFFQLFAPGDDPTPILVPTATPVATETPLQPTAPFTPTLIATPSPIPPSVSSANAGLPTPTPLPPPTNMTPSTPRPTATWVPSPTPVGWTGVIPNGGGPATLPPPDFPAPTAGPSPTIIASEVLLFDASPTMNVAPGETFTVRYEVSGSGPVSICSFDQNTWVRQCASNLPLAGTLDFIMPDSVFYLDVELFHSGVPSAEKPVVRVNATCTHPWFFQYEGDACPNQPQNYYSVKAQQFEGGLMVDDVGRITVYFDDGTYRVYWSDYSGGGTAGLTPPDGLLLPDATFAGTWANGQNAYTADLFDRLGWAVSAPYNFATTTQCEFSPMPFSPCYRLMPDSRVIRLEGGIVAESGNTVTEGNWSSLLESN